eukprot:NODE_671_length_4854_cov_0.553312.p4 type:complete len:269 gc:universal NODE_671_length_4854_cov_0.553312:3758-2952(-)
MFKIGQVDYLSDISANENLIFVGGLSSSLIIKKDADAVDPTMLDCGISSGVLTKEKLYFTTTEHKVFEYDLETKNQNKIDEHEYLVTQMKHTPYGLITMGLDRKIHLNYNQIIDLESAPLRMAVKDHLLHVALMDKTKLTFDLRHFDKPVSTGISGLKFMIRDMIYHASDLAYSSIEGRVQCSETFAFKCHRKKVADQEYIYPVHALASISDQLVTGGADGNVAFWDVVKKKRTKITEIGGSIYRLANFNNELVIGTEEGKIVTIPVQ